MNPETFPGFYGIYFFLQFTLIAFLDLFYVYIPSVLALYLMILNVYGRNI
jgi:hypothetical protein